MKIFWKIVAILEALILSFIGGGAMVGIFALNLKAEAEKSYKKYREEFQNKYNFKDLRIKTAE